MAQKENERRRRNNHTMIAAAITQATKCTQTGRVEKARRRRQKVVKRIGRRHE